MFTDSLIETVTEVANKAMAKDKSVVYGESVNSYQVKYVLEAVYQVVKWQEEHK